MSKNTTNKSAISFLKDNPIRTMIFVFIALLIFFLAIYFGNILKNNRRFYFEKKDNNPVYLYQGDLSKASDFQEYLTFEKVTVTFTKNTKESDFEFFGNYYFSIDFKKQKNYSVSFKTFLMSDFSNKQTAPTTGYPNSANTNLIRSIDYTYEKDFKTSKYLFFTVDKPALYFEITVSQTDQSTGLPSKFIETFYYRLDYTINTIK